jgi:hypothetical protein
MALPSIYRRSAEGPIASYNATDIAAGTGDVIFYGFSTGNNAGIDFGLSTSTYISNNIESSGAVNATGSSWDMDFDTSPFNLPQSIKGTGYVHYSVMNVGTTRVWEYAKLYKWDGSTETLICEASGAWYTNSTGARFEHLLMLTIPKTHFKKGETMRLTVGQMVKEQVDASVAVIGTDPMGRDGSFLDTSVYGISTKLMFTCPFVIDL